MKSFAYPIEKDTSSYGSIDRQFLQSVFNVLEWNPDFDLQQLSLQLKMSKPTLYRRIKSITGLSPKDFIRKARLRKACIILLNKSVNVTETAYIIGFSDPKYFSNCFKREFGLTPSEYRKSTGKF